MALTSCIPPARGSPLFELGEDEVEMGIGIHGEPGRRREKMRSANGIVDELVEALVTPISELYLLYGRAHDQPDSCGIGVGRSCVGEYCTSLDMAGASVTLVRLDDEITSLLAAPAEVPVRVF